MQTQDKFPVYRNSKTTEMDPMINCCQVKDKRTLQSFKKIVIVGNPNVGKSVLFNNLTGRYMTVANYPGTTVQVARGKAKIGDAGYEVIDTPGMYSFSSITEEEKVARAILIQENPYLVIHIVDAKNLERMLAFTLQLLEASLPTLLVLNMMDEAERSGVRIDIPKLGRELKIPVVGAVSTTGAGMSELREKIQKYRGKEHGYQIPIDGPIEAALSETEKLLNGEYKVSKRLIELLVLEGDQQIEKSVGEKQPEIIERLRKIREEMRSQEVHPIEYELAIRPKSESDRIAHRVMKIKEV